MKPNIKKISKFLSLILRHNPHKIKLKLDKQGWADTQELINKIPNLTLSILQEVVKTNNKKRFAFNADGSKIRASQGHSIPVDLGYSPSIPPAILYHGTATRFVASIQQKGLIKGNRQQVHLSKDSKTATNVGQRHGKVVLISIDTAPMLKDGFDFFVSENGVWLIDAVPAQYLNILLDSK